MDGCTFQGEAARSIWPCACKADEAKNVYTFRSSNKMPAAVKGAIQDAAKTAGGLSEEEAKAFLKGLQEDGRLFEECWS